MFRSPAQGIFSDPQFFGSLHAFEGSDFVRRLGYSCESLLESLIPIIGSIRCEVLPGTISLNRQELTENLVDGMALTSEARWNGLL